MGRLWMVFLGGTGEGKRTRQSKYYRVVFARDVRVQTDPFFYFIYYILSRSGSGGFTTGYNMCQTIVNGPRSSMPRAVCVVQVGTVRRPLPHTEDSEGSDAPRSDTDSTDQWA